MTLRHLLPYSHSAIITNAGRDLRDHKSTLPSWYIRKLRPRDLLKVTRGISDRARTRTQNFLTIPFSLSYWQNVEWMCDWRLNERRTGLSVCLHRAVEDLPMWEPNFEMVPQKSCSLSIVLAFISAVPFLWNASLAFKVLYKVQCNATFPVKPSITYYMSRLSFFPQCIIHASIRYPSHNLMGHKSFIYVLSTSFLPTKQTGKPNFRKESWIWTPIPWLRRWYWETWVSSSCY